MEKEFEETNDLEMKENYECQKCGSVLNDEQEFCPKCGTKKGDKNNKKCPKCGTILAVGEKFCSKCGAKVKINISSDVVQEVKFLKLSPKIIKILIVCSIIIAVAIIFFTGILPKLMINYRDLMSEGKYVEAYKKANDKEKEEVETENLIAYLSKEIIKNLKDPKSFSLNRAYKTSDKLVIIVNANNSYGASVLNYYYYTYNESKQKFELWVSLSDLKDETIYKYADDSEEKLEKTMKNLARSTVRNIISNEDNKVNKEIIDNINNLFKTNILDNVELLPSSRKNSNI